MKQGGKSLNRVRNVQAKDHSRRAAVPSQALSRSVSALPVKHMKTATILLRVPSRAGAISRNLGAGRCEWMARMSRGPTLMHEDSVLIDTSEVEINRQDRIWVLSYGDLGMIKRVRRRPGGRFRILSDNATVPPMSITMT
jgi:hypothetical protein